MAARKPTRKPVKRRGPPSPMIRMNALYDTLEGISRLFGDSTVTYAEDEITIEVTGFRSRTYSIDKDDGTLTVTTGRETYRTFIEEPIAFLLDHTSWNDAFKDAYEQVADYTERSLR